MSHEQMAKSVWPPPPGITVLDEIIVSPETVEKHLQLLLNSLPSSVRKTMEKAIKEVEERIVPDTNAET